MGGGNKRHRKGAKEVWYVIMKDIKIVILHICIANRDDDKEGVGT